MAKVAEVMSEVQTYLDMFSQYDKEFAKWEGRVEKILKRYRDDRTTTTAQSHYNILWANVQTLKAATFSRMPKPDVSRRHKDNDPVARVASMLLERALDFEITHTEDFQHALQACVYDRFLGGRGTSWVRYEPVIETEQLQVSEESEESEVTGEYLDIEQSPVDYVHWRDFGHSYGRTWPEVNCVWRKVYMNRSALKERFPEEQFDMLWKQIPLDASPDEPRQKMAEGTTKQALIYEVWDREERCVYWISKSMGRILDKRDDPLQLEEFFPCPEPIYSTLTNESLVPVPDFTLYQDQANELDTLSDRIKGLVNALKVRGFYDAANPDLNRLFTEGDNNTLIPVKNYAAFAEKGGLGGAVTFVDLAPIANALNMAYQAMGQVKQQIYDITGISDIVRGASNAGETATAQQIKGQYATLRLKTYQDEVARFASQILRIKAQIICQHFQPETIFKIGGAELLSDTDKQLIPQAIELLKNNPMRTFRVEVSTDSMLYADETQEKQDRVEFLTATSSFIEKAVQGAQAAPELTPLLMDLLKFGVQGFRVGRTLEGEFDTFADQAKDKQKQLAANPPQPQPNPEVLKMQAEQQKSQADMQMTQAKMQQDSQLEQLKLQLAQQEASSKAQLEAERLQFEKYKTELDNQTKVVIAELQAKNDIKKTSMSINGAKEAEGLTEMSDEGFEQPTSALASLVDSINQNMASMIAVSQQHNQNILTQQQIAHENLTAQLTKPKQVVRDINGKISGVQ
jgi:hypothetical protein